MKSFAFAVAALLFLSTTLTGCSEANNAAVNAGEAIPVTDAPGETVTARANPFGIAAGDALRWLADPIPEKRAELDRQLGGMQALGVGWVRVDFPWHAIQPVSKSQFYWNSMDVLVDGISSRNMQVLGILDYTPEWARAKDCQRFTCPPASIDDFAAYARAAATRYASRGVHTWEIWNEPNLSGFWTPSPDPVRYAQLAAAATKAIKEVDPNATVIVGALGYNGEENGDMHPVKFLQKVYEASPQGFDAVSYHAYSYPMMPTDAASYNGWSMLDSETPSIYQVMKRNGDGDKKIWITEYGAPALSQQASAQGVKSTSRWMVSDLRQAQMMQDAVKQVEGSEHIAKFFWYSYKDLGKDPSSLENFFGLTDAEGNKKPAYDLYRELIASHMQGVQPPAVMAHKQ